MLDSNLDYDKTVQINACRYSWDYKDDNARKVNLYEMSWSKY